MKDGILQADSYDFGQYKDGSVATTATSLDGKFAPGFDPTPYDFTWIRYNRLDEAGGRYFVKVEKHLHGKWFKPNAFHAVHPGIVCGEKFMNGERPEFYLMVRSAEARRQEQAQMLRKTVAQSEVENRDEFKAVVSGLGRDLGSANVTGGITRSARSGW